MELNEIAEDILQGLIHIDKSGIAFKEFRPGVGPFGEPQLIKLIAEYLNSLGKYPTKTQTKRTPDLLIPGEWAMEFKITRPFGDNGKEAEDWSVNLLHPYPGNVSSIGDCYKLMNLHCPERRAVVVIGYEHNPCQINLSTLIKSFEVIARNVAQINLSDRVEKSFTGLCHPIHQTVRLFLWEVISKNSNLMSNPIL